MLAVETRVILRSILAVFIIFPIFVLPLFLLFIFIPFEPISVIEIRESPHLRRIPSITERLDNGL